MARKIHKTLQRKLTGIHMVKHDRHQRLHTGHAGRRCRIWLLLFFQRMRRMVGTEHINDTLINALPDTIAMALVTYRRVHLNEITECRILIG
ncbi:hypothetical protein D9M70_652210 [compost metagenome]